jgi:hypothetical protein
MSKDCATVVTGEPGIVAMTANRFHALFCGARGHYFIRQFEPGRMSLRCLACAYESPGWTIDDRAARPGTRQPQPFRILVQQDAP